MRGSSARGILKYASRCLRLKGYLRHPGDGRVRPQIGARHLLWGLLLGYVLREYSCHGVEWLARSRARRAMAVGRGFGDDALGHFTQRLDPEPTRQALATACRQAKRNKALDNSRFIGLAIDGTGAGRSRQRRCQWCVPVRNDKGEVGCHGHHRVMVAVAGSGLMLPVDVEPWAEGDSEHIAHHHTNAVLITWLLMILAMTIERLYRLRYLHRGSHQPPTAIELVRALRLSLGSKPPYDSS